jgi:hypothetical protein
MKKSALMSVVTFSSCLGLLGGFTIASLIADRDRTDGRYERYTDQARTYLEAAALLRNNLPDAARAYLERQAQGSLRGVPMGRAYDEMSPDSQALLVTARRYEASFRNVDFELDQLTRGDVPSDHPMLSLAVRSATRKAEL